MSIGLPTSVTAGANTSSDITASTPSSAARGDDVRKQRASTGLEAVREVNSSVRGAYASGFSASPRCDLMMHGTRR